MNYGEVLSRAWYIFWRYKVLWIFGLFASLAAGGDSGVNPQFNFRFSGGRIPLGNAIERAFEQLPVLSVILLLIAGVTIVLLLVLLSALGQAGLVRGAWRADDGETGLLFGGLFQEGMTYFWRVLLLGLLMWAIGVSLVLLIVLPTLLTLGLALLCLWPLICMLVPLFWGLTVLFRLAIIAIVGENLGVMDGLRRAWELFRSHLVEVIVMAIALAILALVVNFLISLPALLVAVPLLTVLFNQPGNLLQGNLIRAAMLLLFYLPFLLAGRALLTTYIDSAWTVTFRRLSGRAPVSPALVQPEI